MANAKKPTEEANKKSIQPKADKESNALEKQVEELKAQLAMMAQMLTGQTQVKKTSVVARTIPIYNMTKATLILKGNVYHQFDKQFDMQGISENEVRQIVQNMPESTRNGLFYIADSQFVNENELNAVYETILSVDELKGLLNKDSKNVIEIYMNASKGQKEIICEMITDGCLNGMPIDANILMQIGKLSGRDFMGIKRINE